MRRFKARRTLLVVGALSLAGSGVLVACGDDGDDVEAYCELSAETDQQEEFPSDELLDDIAEAAPEEISEEAQFVVDRLKEDGEAAFEDTEVLERFETIEEFEAENCDAGSGDSETS